MLDPGLPSYPVKRLRNAVLDQIAPRAGAARLVRLLRLAAGLTAVAALAVAGVAPAAETGTPRPAAANAAAEAPATNPFAAGKAPAADPESCAGCHAALLHRKVVHAAMSKVTCTSCHKATQRVGRCKSPSASAWAPAKPPAELCAGCHDEKKLAAPFKVKHDFKGRCVECHDAHSSDEPRLMRATGRKLCLSCHDKRSGAREVTKRIELTRQFVHAALDVNECQDCHESGHGGSRESLLKVAQPELCYGCHERKDKTKVVHTAVSGGECLACHDVHSSNLPALLKRPREQLCLECHDPAPLLTRPVKHAPVAEGRCLECHEPHGSDTPNMVRGPSRAVCLKCHDAKAGASGGVSEARRLDLSRKVVHGPVAEGECTECHLAGHSGDQPRLLKKATVDICYGCHDRKDAQRFTHGAVRLGDCAVCHLPHSSDFPNLAARATIRETCFTCHQDDLTGRAVQHRPAAEGKCDACHDPHGAANRWVLTKGDGKQACYACHRPVDGGKVKHAALERYGCTGCHDPHGAANRFLLGKTTNDLCVSCHPKQPDGLHVTAGRSSKGGHVVSGLLDPRRPDREFSCASCHDPHGSDSPRLFYMGEGAMESCDGCHGDKTGKNPLAKNVIHRAYPPKAESGNAGGVPSPSPPPPSPPPPAPTSR